MSSLQSILDGLQDLHYSKLQKFCRKVPDAPFDQLLLTRDEWNASLETGAGCKQAMITNITKYHNQTLGMQAKKDKKKKQPKPAMREAYEASHSDSDSGPDSPTGDAVPAPEPQEQLDRLAHWQEHYKANWLSVSGKKDTPPAVKFTTRVDKPLPHTVWLEASTKFYKRAFDTLNEKTQDDQYLRARVLGEKLAKLLLAKNSGDSTGTVHLALMDGVGRILFETLRVTREVLTDALRDNKDQDADKLLNKKLSVTIYDIMRNMNDCHRLLMPNVTVAAANIIPGNGAAHLEGVDVVYFNFASLIMSDKGKVPDFVEGAYQTNKKKELSAESQKDKLRDCILALPKSTKVMVSVYTARAAESLEDVLPSDDFVLKSVSARANFETAWVRKTETA